MLEAEHATKATAQPAAYLRPKGGTLPEGEPQGGFAGPALKLAITGGLRGTSTQGAIHQGAHSTRGLRTHPTRSDGPNDGPAEASWFSHGATKPQRQDGILLFAFFVPHSTALRAGLRGFV